MKYFLVIFLLSLVLFFSFLGGTSVFPVAEARNAECAREMLQQNNWVVPTFNGELRTDKPVLEYYGMMIAYLVGGVNEASARFFSAVCGVLIVLATFWIAKRHISLKAAWWSALILLSSMHVVAQFRVATPDPYLIFCHTLSLYLFYEGWSSGKWKWYGGMYIFLGLGILAKGPVGLLLPALSAFVFLLATQTFNWRTILALKPWWGILLTLLFSLPWYLAVDMETGGRWTQGFFWEHNFDRFNSGMGSHSGPFVLSFLFIIAGMLPFSVFAVRAFRNAWKSKKAEPILLFAIISVASVAVFYAFSKTKLINYTTPAYPFLAIIIGGCIAKLVDEKQTKKLVKPELYIFALLAVAFPFAAYFLTQNTEPLDSVSWIFWFFLFLPIGALLALFLSRKSLEKGILAMSITFMLATVVFFAGPYQIIDDQSPIRKYEELVRSHENVVAYKNFDDAFAFYVQNPIPVFQTEKELEAYLGNHKDVLVLCRDRNLTYMDSIPNLRRVSIDHDLFSRRSSGVYHNRSKAVESKENLVFESN
ncbi:ArnT family glycosyltransferase [Mangrovibacterium lignilyticum]|uniref:ArnT family glycosyltransferase n=1 Tax=Mangrovibacterium lignilyticum TaxID=2668052 RepID=UPI0013D7CAE6|nr:glycosyltransferase family 39 protein [Mangrovibacterium lignilyticum]